MTAKFHTAPPPSDAHRPLNVPQTADETVALLTASLTIVKARTAADDEAMLDEVARRRGVNPVRARAVRECIARETADSERAACAREVLAAYARRDWQSAAMHGAALADLTLEGE